MERKREIEAAVADVRNTEKREGVTRGSLEKIKQRLIRLARPKLFPASDFPPPTPGLDHLQRREFYKADEGVWRVFPAHADIREAR